MNRIFAPRCGWMLPRLLFLLGVFLHALPGKAATLIVTNLADSGPGTLRDRIAASAPGDTIQFGVLGTITLNSSLVISTNLTVNGGLADRLKISGNNSHRVFSITGGTAQLFNMTIADGRVVGTNGAAGANGQNQFGAGVLVGSEAKLSIISCILSNNVVIGGQGGPPTEFGSAGNGGNGYGGAVAALGQMTMITSYLISNTASGGLGGLGPPGSEGAGGQGWGGALYSEASGYVLRATFHGNNAVAGIGGGGPGGAAGGGIYATATLTLLISTIASNSATGSSFDSGGGAEIFGPALIHDCTIVGNQADFGGGISGGGELRNTILAANSAGSGPDGSGTFDTLDYNLIQNPSGMTFNGPTTHHITGQNPLLGTLQFNAGPDISFRLPTMMPLPGSPVIDKGLTPNNGDQRHFPRYYDTTLPNAVGGNAADIGAVEVTPMIVAVTNSNSTGPGSLRQAVMDNNGWGGGHTIVISNNVSGTINLASVELTLAAPATIVGPGANQLAVSANGNSRVFTVLEGPSEISGLTIRDGLVIGSEGQQGQNGFDGRGGGIFNQATLSLIDCVVKSNTVIGGLGGERHLGSVGMGGHGLGGGIYNVGGEVTLSGCVFEGNRALGGQGGVAMNGEAGGAGNGLGGAVCSTTGTNVFIQCGFMNNTAQGGQGGSSGGSVGGNGGQGYGAGIYVESWARLDTSTMAGGSAIGGTGGAGETPGGAGSGYGGGIYSVSDLALRSCTIASNNAVGSSFDFGGGIYASGTTALTNSTIAGNQADFGGGLSGNANAGGTLFALNTAGSGADVQGTINSYDYNLIQSFPGLTIVGSTAHVIIGQNPLLGPLQDNGGPTLTMALLPGSPAIDQGHSFGTVTDQRGTWRSYNLPSIANPGGGDGADIGAFEFLPSPVLNIAREGANVVLSWSTDAGDYFLDSAPAVWPGDNWSELTTMRVIAGDQVFVTNSAAEPASFYRLRFPMIPAITGAPPIGER